jgi:23S rRNA pseudouridine2605 synthase
MERLQKILARAGLGSRREMERWIEAGRVSVNGDLITLGASATEGDVIRVDGKVVSPQKTFKSTTKVLGYHKPIGLVCSRDDEKGRDNVFNYLPGLTNGRWINIGRLDLNTSGLLLFTTDGELANKLMHPSSNIDREYAVRVKGVVDEDVIKRLKEGVELDDGPARFTDIADAGGEGTNHWYHVVLTEGRNREVRRLWESQDVMVSRLMRVRYGPVFLPRGMKPGKTWYLEEKEIDELREWAGMIEPKNRPAARGREEEPRREGRRAPNKGADARPAESKQGQRKPAAGRRAETGTVENRLSLKKKTTGRTGRK